MPFSSQFRDPAEQALLEPQFHQDYGRWKRNPDPHNSTIMLQHMQPFVDKAIMAHVGQMNPILRSKGRQLALRALGSYDPNRSKLQTHIVNQLQSLKRASRQQTQVLRVPERVSLEQGHALNATNELRDELGREPTAYEVADRSGLSLKRLQYVQQHRQPLAEGTAKSWSSSDEDDEYSPAVRSNASTHYWPEFVYDELEPVNQKILEWTLGLHGQQRLSNQMIAAKLQISPGAVSQRKALIQKRLDQEDILSPF